jgi:hypothetical protein
MIIPSDYSFLFSCLIVIVISSAVELYSSAKGGFDGMAVLNSLGNFLGVFLGAFSLGSAMGMLTALVYCHYLNDAVSLFFSSVAHQVHPHPGSSTSRDFSLCPNVLQHIHGCRGCWHDR